MKIKTHRDLIVWQKGMSCAELVYEVTSSWPKEELYGLTFQIRRAVVSIAANIAEGHGRGSRRDYAYFISIAKGSVQETATLLELGIRLRYVDTQRCEPIAGLLFEVEKMLGKLHIRLTEH